MNMYVFGNSDLNMDNRALIIAKKLKKEFPAINFIFVHPNQDLPFVNENNVYLMDVVFGIQKPIVITKQDIDKLILPPRSTAHDYDLAFQLRYLLKLKKLKQITIIGLPMEGDIDYSSIQSIFKKLVAHDIHGS